MDTQDLVDAIEQATAEHPPHDAREIPPASLQRLARVIAAQQELRIFDGQCLEVSDICGASHEELADWLVHRAWSVGARQTIRDLERYLASDFIPVRVVAVVDGLSVEGEIDLGEGVTLLPFDRLPPSRGTEEFSRYLDLCDVPSQPPDSAVVVPSMLPRYQVGGPQEAEDYIKRHFAGYSRVLDVCRVLVVANLCPVVVTDQWREAPEWVPCGDALDTIDRFRNNDWIINKCDLDSAAGSDMAETYQRYLTLAEETKQVLRTAMDRLNAALVKMWFEPQEEQLVNAAIDLGVAIESFFLHDWQPSEGELTFTLRLRAARFLAETIQQRSELAQVVGDVYSVRSDAVHRGTVRSKRRHGRTPKELLEAGTKMLSAALRKTINRGRLPDWDQVVYG